MNIILVLNREAGSLRGRDVDAIGRDLAAIFRADGHAIAVKVCASESAIAEVKAACRQRTCEAVIIGGGDGTVSAAASAVAGGQVALGVLPLGTMNLFARSLRIPLEMRAAATALSAGRISTIDIAEVNGRPFIHHVTVGLHPNIVRERERYHYRSRLGKIWANVRAWWVVLRRPPRLHATIRADGKSFERKATVILLTNNPFGDGHLPYADDLKQGKLGLYISSSRRWSALLELTARLTLGEISTNPLLEMSEVEGVEISLGRVVKGSVDGEIVELGDPLRLKVRRRGLRVLVPAPVK